MRRVLLSLAAGIAAASCSPQDEPLSPAFDGPWAMNGSGPCLGGGVRFYRGRIVGPLGVTMFTVKKATVSGSSAHLVLTAEGFLDTMAAWSEPAMTGPVNLSDLDISVTLNASATQVSPSGVVMKHRDTGNFAGDADTQRRIARALRVGRCEQPKDLYAPVKPNLVRN